MERTANIVGAGVNGLAAAIVLAQAGMRVTVFEAETTAGGAARTMELTLPGFHHDFGAAVLPLAAGSPFLKQLPLARYGLEWVHADVPVAHPLDTGEAVLLHRELAEACAALGDDGRLWRDFVGPSATDWAPLADVILRPMWPPPLRILKSLGSLAGFGLHALQPASWIARSFRKERTRALWAGIAAHAVRPLDSWGSSAAGLALAAAGHAVGWPMARGGTQALTNAMVAHFRSLGGEVRLGHRVDSLRDLPTAELTLCDVTPGQLVQLAAGTDLLDSRYISELQQFRPGTGAFKVDYALSRPIPWAAAECSQALTVHLGGTFAEIAAAEADLAAGRMHDRPYVLLAQPTLFDHTRAPAGKHICWAYCHVPFGWEGDATHLIERQIERFAPGFQGCVLARSVLSPAGLAARDANLFGGDISGGAMDLRQMLVRPTARGCATSNPKLWLCSSSTAPGGGVHGMCGANAAQAALLQFAR